MTYSPYKEYRDEHPRTPQPVWKSPRVTVEQWALEYGMVWAITQAQSYALNKARHDYVNACSAWVHEQFIIPIDRLHSVTSWAISLFEGRVEYMDEGNGKDWKTDR